MRRLVLVMGAGLALSCSAFAGEKDRWQEHPSFSFHSRAANSAMREKACNDGRGKLPSQPWLQPHRRIRSGRENVGPALYPELKRREKLERKP